MQQRGVVAGKFHRDLEDSGNSSTEQREVLFKKKIKAYFWVFLDARENCVAEVAVESLRLYQESF